MKKSLHDRLTEIGEELREEGIDFVLAAIFEREDGGHSLWGWASVQSAHHGLELCKAVADSLHGADHDREDQDHDEEPSS